MRPPAPLPTTVSPAVATKQSILQRARAVADAHDAEEDKPAKKVSADWRDFFSEQKSVYVQSRGCTFNVYTAGDHGPVVFCLHGAGYTGLTFALLAEELSKDYRIVAMDQRHHGLTTQDTEPGNPPDFSKETFSADAAALWEEMFGEEEPPTVLLGHSFGGAIAVWTAKETPFRSLEGLIVIDVVEGTAIASLPSMTGVLNKRPPAFASPKAAINWVTEHHLSRSMRAATISVPSQLIESPPAAAAPAAAAASQWTWRTPLLASEPCWEGWYSGLSDAFVGVRVPKVLLIAGADRLDRPLTIAQMQGKFQMVLVPQSGHAIQEDEPEEVVQTVQSFIKRFRIGLPPLEIPRATPGLPPVLPQAVGPLFDGRPKPA
eukprot:jgi/Ulvmu1/697/UM010_0069.1